MYYPGAHALSHPDQAAVIVANTRERAEQRISYKTLNDRSNQIAQYLHGNGFRPGDSVAIFMENNIRYFEIVWAVLRSGLVITPINRYLTVAEAAYIINDCGAKALFTSVYMADIAGKLISHIPTCSRRLIVDGACEGFEALEDAVRSFPQTPLVEEPLGQTMLYSSGTTGRPKGVLKTQAPAPVSEGLPSLSRMRAYEMNKDTIYLSPAPIYHAAPLGYSLGVHSLGGTVVMMPRFDAEDALRCLRDYAVTHSQWVPTMFIRMLKLPLETRQQYVYPQHKVAIHAAAPCPVEIKRQMIAWWGPIIYEYYGGSEGNGSTAINSEEWLERPGSVGRERLGVIHICDDFGDEVATGETGLIYFERPEMPFAYHNDPEKTREAQNPKFPNWSTMGDVGYIDADRYLFLTDRKSFMIISGGVNIYPQALEDALVLHPDVADVAVIGVPNEDFGEEVKAIVQLSPGIEKTTALADDLIAFARARVAAYMTPRSVDFVDALPRLPTGKLYKHKLRETYWPKSSSSDG